MKQTKPLLITIVGPTASGKSSLGIELAKRVDGEILSADSRQIYREMNIGTAKITEEETDGILHYLLDIRNPDEEYSMAEFQHDAFEIIDEILSREKQPIVVGGTGLYISSVVENWNIPSVPPNVELRKQFVALSTEELYQKLEQQDPEIASSIDPNNRHRLIRMLEKSATGVDYSASKNPPLYDVIQFGIQVDRDALYERINHRVDAMMNEGLLEEVHVLGEKYGWDSPGINAIGYRQLGMYIREEVTLQEAIELIKRDTRRYAKRQMTWFRRDTTIHWIQNLDEILEFLHKEKGLKIE